MNILIGRQTDMNNFPLLLLVMVMSFMKYILCKDKLNCMLLLMHIVNMFIFCKYLSRCDMFLQNISVLCAVRSDIVTDVDY